jgi:hypothetical protein
VIPDRERRIASMLEAEHVVTGHQVVAEAAV